MHPNSMHVDHVRYAFQAPGVGIYLYYYIISMHFQHARWKLACRVWVHNQNQSGD